jgi:tetratricopeptide (TPR) repeat protein
LSQAGRERAFRLVVAGIAGTALAVRLVQAHALSTDLFAGILVQDARVYRDTALRLLGSIPSQSEGGVSFMNVGYPWFLAAIARALGPSLRAVLVVQAVLGSAACALLALTARAFTGSRAAGVVTGLAALATAPLLFYDGLLLTPSPTFACLSAALWLLARYRLRPRALIAAGVGACLALPVLLRANAVLFVPLAAAAVSRWAPRGSAARQAAALAAAALVLPAAVVLHGGLTHGQWVPLSANAGMNLWIGSHRDATGVYVAAPFLQDGGAEAEEVAFRDEARRRGGDPWMTLAQASAFWRKEALREVRADVPRARALAARKAALFFTGFEAKTNYSMAFVASRSRLLRALPLGFGAIASLGVAGIALLLLNRRPGAILLAGWVAVPWLTCVVFFVSGEYRHAATPALLIGLGALVPETGRSAWPSRAVAVLVLVLAGLAAAWPRPALAVAFAPTLDVRAHVMSLLDPPPGTPAPGPGEVERALAMTAWQKDDLVVRDARLWVHVRGARMLGRRQDAQAALREAADILGRDLRPREGLPPASFLRYLTAAVPARLRELAGLPVVQGDPELRREARLLGATDWAEARANLARGETEAAIEELREAASAARGDPRPRAELGRALLLAGRRGEGLAELRASCLGWPEIPQCAFYVAEAYAREGKLAQARRAATLALDRDPGYAPAAALLREVDAPPPIGQTPTP